MENERQVRAFRLVEDWESISQEWTPHIDWMVDGELVECVITEKPIVTSFGGINLVMKDQFGDRRTGAVNGMKYLELISIKSEDDDETDTKAPRTHPAPLLLMYMLRGGEVEFEGQTYILDGSQMNLKAVDELIEVPLELADFMMMAEKQPTSVRARWIYDVAE